MSETDTNNQNKETDKKEQNKETGKTAVNDKFQFTIAVIIVAPFVAYIGLFHAFGMPTEAKEILTILGAFVGTIVGFYFGQRPVQNLTKEVAEVTTKNTTLKSGLVDSVKQDTATSEKVEKLEEGLANLNNIFGIIKK